MNTEHISFFEDMFKSLYNVRLRDYGIKIKLDSRTHLTSFDPRIPALVIDIKYVRKPEIIEQCMEHRRDLLYKMISHTYLRPYKKLSRLFYDIFPNYKVKRLGDVALATADDLGLLFFSKANKEFICPAGIYSKKILHKYLKHFLIPIVHVDYQVKPIELMSKDTIKKAHKINRALEELGYPHYAIYTSQSGCILECEESDPVIISVEEGRVKKGNRRSQVYREYELYSELSS